MIAFPNCKINIGLLIKEKRPDGFHNIETIFYPVGWHDALEFKESDATTMHLSGIQVPGKESENICLKAYELIRKTFDIPDLEIHLLKNIPIGAGLGGGSSDAAFMLKMLNEYFNLKQDTAQLMELAIKLGSDCPFFIANKPVLATGRGEVFRSIELDLSNFEIVIIYPDIHIATPWAYQNVVRSGEDHSMNLLKIVNQPIETWKEWLINDFESCVFSAHPEVGTIKETLYGSGAVYASLSGSGSAVFGIFEDKAVVHPSLEKYRKWKGSLSR